MASDKPTDKKWTPPKKETPKEETKVPKVESIDDKRALERGYKDTK